MKNYLILSILIFSIPTIAADKVLECKYHNEYLADDCPGVKYTNTYHIVLNTNDFTKSSASAEYTVTTCNNPIASTKRVPMEVTSTTLSFLLSENSYGKSYFHIDRKTLKGGFDTSRKATCTISDFDTSDNQI